MSSEANGAWNRNHASYCWLAEASSGQDAAGAEAIASNYKVGCHDGEGYGPCAYWCPIKDTSEYPKGDIATVNVHIWDGSTITSTSAEACVTYAFSNGGACGDAVSSSVAGTGNYTLVVTDLSEWASANDFAFIDVFTGYDSLIKGYYTAT